MRNKYNPFEGMMEEAFAQALSRGAEFSDEQVQELMQECLFQGGKGLLARLKRNSRSMLKEHARIRRAFQKRLQRRWREPLDLFETCLVIAQEMGGAFNEQHRPAAAEGNDIVFEVLTRLHARVCHLASEVLHLLRGGYASGAMARWRAMHEAVVVMEFVKLHGNDTAERYLLHEHVEGARAAKEYTDLNGFSGEITEQMLSENEAIVDKLLERFGKDFGKDYGWAASALPPKSRLGIKAIEEAVELQKVRPTYRLASHATHANPKSVLFNLEQGQRPRVLLAGPSNAGLADPGANALRHLVLATATLLALAPDETTAMGSMALMELADEGVDAFMRVHAELAELIKENPADVAGEE